MGTARVFTTAVVSVGLLLAASGFTSFAVTVAVLLKVPTTVVTTKIVTVGDVSAAGVHNHKSPCWYRWDSPDLGWPTQRRLNWQCVGQDYIGRS